MYLGNFFFVPDVDVTAFVRRTTVHIESDAVVRLLKSSVDSEGSVVIEDGAGHCRFVDSDDLRLFEVFVLRWNLRKNTFRQQHFRLLANAIRRRSAVHGVRLTRVVITDSYNFFLSDGAGASVNFEPRAYVWR